MNKTDKKWRARYSFMSISGVRSYKTVEIMAPSFRRAMEIATADMDAGVDPAGPMWGIVVVDNLDASMSFLAKEGA